MNRRLLPGTNIKLRKREASLAAGPTEEAAGSVSGTPPLKGGHQKLGGTSEQRLSASV